tara:strand:+ start:1502 stop:2437 length:936 start_codon:yes stop_codon:yes gene_type:complete
MIEKKHNYFYKITNLVNGKYYYGIHSTNNLEDGYMGGGDAIKASVKRYGKENFIKEIIVDYLTRKEASDHEAVVVNVELVKLSECYNIKTGGDNEYTHSEETKKKMSKSSIGKLGTNLGKSPSEETRRKLREANSGEKHIFFGKKWTEEEKERRKKFMLRGERHPNFGKSPSEESRKKMSESHIGLKCGENHYLYGKHLSEETKIKMSESKIGLQFGENNPNFGKSPSDETRQKMRDAKLGKKQSEEHKKKKIELSIGKSCKIMEVLYPSIKEAARQLELTPNTIRHRLKSETYRWSDWDFVDTDKEGSKL